MLMQKQFIKKKSIGPNSCYMGLGQLSESANVDYFLNLLSDSDDEIIIGG